MCCNNVTTVKYETGSATENKTGFLSHLHFLFNLLGIQNDVQGVILLW